jgi:hypothetical protein
MRVAFAALGRTAAAIASGLEPHCHSVAPRVSTTQSDVCARNTDLLQKQAGPGITPCQVKQQQEIGSGIDVQHPDNLYEDANFPGIQNVTSTTPAAEFQDD